MGTAQDGTGHDEAESPAGKSREDALEALRWDWGTAYIIGHDDEHGWHAGRRDRIGGLLTADDPGALRRLIWDDYGLNPVTYPSEGDPGGRVLGTDPGALLGRD